MKELVFFDIDNTLLDGYSQQILLSYLFHKKIIKKIPYFKINLWFILYKIGLIEDPKRTMEYAYKFLSNWKTSDFEAVIDDFFKDKLKARFFKEAIEVIKIHKKEGRELVLISNIVDILAKKIAEYLGINNYLSTRLEIIGGKFTGKIIGDIVYGKEKEKVINDFTKKNNLTLDSSWGYGDHLSDLPFLNLVKKPNAVNPSTALMKIAESKNWPILIFKSLI